jgi:hypothetical protein
VFQPRFESVISRKFRLSERCLSVFTDDSKNKPTALHLL